MTKEVKTMSKKRIFLILCSIAAGSFIFICILNLVLQPEYDLRFFKRWGDKLLTKGGGLFYEKDLMFPGDYTTDYPPLYMLFCGFMAWLCKSINPSINLNEPSNLANFLFRLPSTLIFVASIFVFYYLITSFDISNKKSLIVTSIYAFAPALLINIISGMADCFAVFFLLLSLLFYVKGKNFLTLFACVLGLLSKIQFAFVIPIIGFAVLYRMYKNKQSIRLIGYIIECFAIYVCFYLPFILKPMSEGRVFYLFEILFKVFSHHNRLSVSALNFYYALGLNSIMVPTWYLIINMFVIIAIIAVSIFLFIKKPTNLNLVLISTLSVTSIFMLSTNMHDRYMLPIIGTMMIAAHIINRKKILIVNYFFYIIQFFNNLAIWFLFDGERFKPEAIFILLSVLSVIMFGLFVHETIKFILTKESKNSRGLNVVQKEN